ncbi:unnamed protein product [Schistosoma rodhaini]|uniref:HSA domain-containing protein n=1 Tax=Schistosoma rodhaini TaxID=6188 RepID=A0AA85G760_9TREM|nr:unnamed protein product [Schistosoma rodhaini]
MSLESMECNEMCGILPPRKMCLDQTSELFSLEELGQILSLCSYSQDLGVVNQELDLLDDVSTSYVADKIAGLTNGQQHTSCNSAHVADFSPGTHSIFIPRPREDKTIQDVQVPDECELPSKNDAAPSCQEIVLDAKREASVLQQVSRLHKKGLWSSDRLPKVMEPKCGRLHYTHLLNEAIWLSVDFCEEMKWKKYMASKLARAAQLYLITRHEWNQQLQRFEEQLRMGNAARVAKMIKDWWGDVGQDLNLVSLKTSQRRWDYAYKENQHSIAHFSDMGPSWLAAVKFDLEDAGFHESPDISHNLDDGRIMLYIDDDGDIDDKDWKPDVDESSTGPHSCSRSTSSSLAASFVDDSDMSGFGVSVYSPTDPISPEYRPEINLPSFTKAYNQVNKHLGSDRRRKSQSEHSYTSDCGHWEDASEETHDITSEARINSNSPESCDQSVESNEVQGLISDMEVPLNRFLEPYIDQGWCIKNRVTPRSGYRSSDSDISNCELDCCSFNMVSQHLQKEISILRNEADMPLHQILPSGYIDFLAKMDEQKCSTVCNLQLSSQSNHHVSGSSKINSKIDGDDSGSLSVTNDTLYLDNGDRDLMQLDSVSSKSSGVLSLTDRDHSECDNSPSSKSSFHMNSRMVLAPWYSSPLPSTPSRLADLHAAALELLPLKLVSIASTGSPRLIPEVCTLPYSPTLRIPCLPTPSLGAAVTWMRHAFARGVPVLLLTNSHLSGDAELAVAAHFGQLSVVDPRHYLLSESSGEICNNTVTGVWGPHLIVTPRLCLPAWRRRLQMWCPGFRVICLGLGRRSERPGTGHRLRDSVARGSVNICLISYSALRSKPSRFTRIQWSSVIFDQIQHIILQSYKSINLAHSNSTSRQPAISKASSREHDPQNAPVYCETDSFLENATEDVNMKMAIDRWSFPKSTKTLIHRKSEWFDLILNKLGRNGHRILISSSSDIIYHKHSPHLLDLSKLLLLNNLPNDENYGSWLNDFFQTVSLPSRQDCSPSLLTKPSKKQLLKFLDPFVIRFDDEDEWDSLVNDEVIECRMSSIQQKLHDKILSTKAAENALKTGNLLDLLQTVSVAVRACNHPSLAGTHPRSSRMFRHTLGNLQTGVHAVHGPYVFKSMNKLCDSNNHCYSNCGLLFSTPESVLLGVKLLRDTELSDITSQFFNLSEALKPSAYIRSRIANLTPQFHQLLSSINHQTLSNNRNVTISENVSNSVDFSPESHIPNGNLESNHFKNGNQLTNGFPQSQHLNSENCVDPDIEIVSIPQRQKRQRSSGVDRNSVFSKRRRVEEYSSRLPFLDYTDIGSTSYHKSSNWSSSHLSLSSDPYMAHSDQFRSTTNMSNNLSHTVNHNNSYNLNDHLNNNGNDNNLNENAYPWLIDNHRKCTQLTDFADWCSQDTCNLLRLDLLSDNTTSDSNAYSKNSQFKSFNVYSYKKESDIWNIVLNQFSQWNNITSALCTRPRVIATPARIISRVGPINPLLLFDKKKTTSMLSNLYCSQSSWSFSLYSSILSRISHTLYPLTEQARWLTPSCCSKIGFHSSLLSSFSSNFKSSVGQLLLESGKFYNLHQKLTELLGVKSHPTATTTNNNNNNLKKRPRCIYFIAHQTAFLDLLEAYLSASSWRLFHRVRIPSNYKSVNANTWSLIDCINSWPQGTIGPLLVLIHARSPTTSLISLRADSNVHIIICDVDWRVEVTDNLKAIVHSWILNGLSYYPSPLSSSSSSSLSSTSIYFNNDKKQKINISRLLSTNNNNYSTHRISIETCLLHGVSCRLLPRAVFHAHSTTHVNCHSLLFARVQPNVVNELLSGIIQIKKLSNRQLFIQQKMKSIDYEHIDLFNDRHYFGSIHHKHDTLSHSSTSSSSIASSFSYIGYDNRFNESINNNNNNKIINEDDDILLFHEREPLSELLLHQALELFEDPIDTQAWCCTNAEEVAIVNEFISQDDDNTNDDNTNDDNITDDFHYLIDDGEVDLDDLNRKISDEFDTNFVQLSDYNKRKSYQDCLMKQLGYTDLIGWEVANYELLSRISLLESQLTGEWNNDWLSYHNHPSVNHNDDNSVVGRNEQQQSQHIESSTSDVISSYAQLPIWCPFKSYLKSLHSTSDTNESMIVVVKDDSMHPLTSIEDYYLYSNDDWASDSVGFNFGYETVPMTESELPPLIIPTPSPVVQTNNNINDNNIVDRKSGRRRPVINHSSLSSSTSLCSRPLNDNINNSIGHVTSSSSYRNGSRLNNRNLKRRALTSPTNSLPRKSNSSSTAYYNTFDESSTMHTTTNTGSNLASIENETRSQDGRMIGFQQSHSRDLSSTGVTISSTCSTVNNTVSLSPISSSTNIYTNNSIVLSLHSSVGNTSGNSATLKLHIPRASYNKAVTNARIHRLRRINNTNIGSGSDVATVAAVASLAAGAHLLQQQQHVNAVPSGYSDHNHQHLSNTVMAAAAFNSSWNSVLTNPSILARYGYTTGHVGSVNSLSGRHLSSSLQNYMQATNNSQCHALKYPVGGGGGTSGTTSILSVNNNSSSSTNNAGQLNNVTQMANQLYVGKPPDWLIYEEAALYLCITKLQELNFEINNSNSNLSTSTPNYRFAEFFLNNYLPNRSYRGARQCLLVHFKMQNIVSSANITTSSSTLSNSNNNNNSGINGGVCSINNPFTFNPDDLSHSISVNPVSSLHHGPSSRKVKSKMKSAAVAAAAAAAAAAATSSSVIPGSVGGTSQFCNNVSGASGSVFGAGVGSVGGSGNPSGVAAGGSAATSAASVAAALNRCRGYLFYQHLQAWLNLMLSLDRNDTNHTNITTDSSNNISAHLSPIIHALKFAEDSQASFLRKAIRDTLSVPPVQIPSIYRSSGSRRTCVVGGGSSNSSTSGGGTVGNTSSSLSSTASSALGYHPNTNTNVSGSGTGTSTTHYNIHHASNSGQLSSHSLTGHSTISNTPALLTHHRYRHHMTYDHGQSQNPNITTADLNSASGSTTGVVHSGPIIQKNPTHIAALQEHNINPDTLITPAMVIKNKEEREARQRAETLSTANQVVNLSTTTTSSSLSTNNSNLTNSTVGIFQGDNLSDLSNSQQTENVCLHSHTSHPSSLSASSTSSSDHVYKTSAYSYSGLTSGSESTISTFNLLSCSTTSSSLPTTSSFLNGRTNAQLSFAHNLSHRGSSVMLPIRSGFCPSTVTPSGSVLSFNNQQQQPHRLLGTQNTSSSSVGHYQFQPRQTLLNSSVGRLTHLTSGASIVNAPHLTGTHHVISSGAVASVSSSLTDDSGSTRSVDLNSGSILIPGNWRTSTNPRSLNVQTIVSSTPTVLRRSATFTGIGLSNQSTSGLQTCRLNPALSSISQSLSTTPFTGTYLNTQVTKLPNSSSTTGQSNFYIHQRPQFLSSTQTSGSSSGHGVLTTPSNIAVISGASNNYSPSVTHIPQILRPRNNALRGSIVQPTFVRTFSTTGVSGTSGSVIPVPVTQHGTRLSSNVVGGAPTTSMFLGRVATLNVSSNNPSVSSILNASRTGTQRSVSPTVFQSLRTCISGGVVNSVGNEQPHSSSQSSNNNSSISGSNK